MLPALDQPFTAVPWATIDLETDNVDPAVAMPCEIAVARFERGELVGTWSTLLNPGREMSAEVIGVHGITNEMVADAHPAAEIAVLFGSFYEAHALLEGAWPVGYNGQGYDRTILRRLDAASVPYPPWLEVDWIDPLVIIRDIDRFVAGSGRHRLSVTCARHGIEHVDAHRAFGDCVATGKLLWSLRERVGELTIGQLLKKQAARAKQQEADFQRWLSRQPKRDDARQGGGNVA